MGFPIVIPTHHFFLFLAVATLTSLASAGQPPAALSQIDSYVLAIQWPTAYCNGSKLRRNCTYPYPPYNFTIHGLFALEANGKHHNCEHALPLDKEELKPLEEELKVYWPDLTGYHYEFWEYEWQKHGYCAELGTTGPFFKKVLDLRKDLNERISRHLSPGENDPVWRALNDAGVKEGGTYAKRNFTDAFNGIAENITETESFVYVTCNEHKEDKVKQVLELRFCYKRETMELSPCVTHDEVRFTRYEPPYENDNKREINDDHKTNDIEYKTDEEYETDDERKTDNEREINDEL